MAQPVTDFTAPSAPAPVISQIIEVNGGRGTPLSGLQRAVRARWRRPCQWRSPVAERDDEGVPSSRCWREMRDNGPWPPGPWAGSPPWRCPGPAGGSDFSPVLLTDPYGAVRYMAPRSLLKQPGYEDVTFDFLAPEEDRTEVAAAVIARSRDAGHDPGQGTAGFSSALRRAGAASRWLSPGRSGHLRRRSRPRHRPRPPSARSF